MRLNGESQVMTPSLSSDQGMLTMRVLSLLVVFLCASSAWAQSQEIKNPVPPITSETKGATKPKDNTNSQQAITVGLSGLLPVSRGSSLS
jgi:hypothetical protein